MKTKIENIEDRKWKWEDQISWAPHCLHLFRIWTKNGRRAGFSVGGVPSHAEGWQVGNLDPLFQRRQRNHRQACHRAQRCLFNLNYILAIKACSTCFQEPTSSSTWQGGKSQGKCQSRPVPGCSSQVCCISCTRRCPQCSTGSRTPASSSCSWHPDHLKAFDDCHQEEGQHLDVLQPAWWGDRGDTTTTFSTSTTTPATHLLWTLWYRWTLRRLWKVRIPVLWPLWLWLRTDWPWSKGCFRMCNMLLQSRAHWQLTLLQKRRKTHVTFFFLWSFSVVFFNAQCSANGKCHSSA